MGSPFHSMPKKIREIKAILKQAGFMVREGKGSHSNWKHPLLPLVITIARRDDEDAPRYLERQVQAAIAQLKEKDNGQS
jgi:predicted RNA binding protein YcfA (HicA-like mRNA interferase family)